MVALLSGQSTVSDIETINDLYGLLPVLRHTSGLVFYFTAADIAFIRKLGGP